MGFILSLVAIGTSIWWFVDHQFAPNYDHALSSFVFVAAGQVCLAGAEGIKNTLRTNSDYEDADNPFVTLFAIINVSLLYVVLALFAYHINFILAFALFASLSFFFGSRFTNFGYQIFWGVAHWALTKEVGKKGRVKENVESYYILSAICFLIFMGVIANLLDL